MMSGTVVSTLVFAWNQVQSFLRVPLMRAVKDFDVDDRLAFSSWWDACRQVRQLHAVCHMLALACEHDLRAAFAIKLKGRNRYIEQLNEIARRRRKGHYDWNAWKPISGACHVLGSDENNGNDAQRYMPEIGHQHYDMPRKVASTLGVISEGHVGHQHYDMPGIRLRLALDGNLYSYAQFRDWYGEEASYRCWFEAEVDVSKETAAYVWGRTPLCSVLGSDVNDGNETGRPQEVKLQPLPPPDYPPPGWSANVSAQASMTRRHAEIPSKYAAVPDADPGSDEAQPWDSDEDPHASLLTDRQRKRRAVKDAKDRHGCHCHLRNRMCLCHIEFKATFLDGLQRS